MDEPDLTREVAFAAELADLAAAVTMAAFGGRQEVEFKADRTPVTGADRGAERAMRAAVASAFPDDDFLGEEDGRTGSGRSGRTWVVDPIDGTKNFAAGVPLWSTAIALSTGDRPLLGLLDVPPLGRRYRATRGSGSWLNDGPIAVSGVADISEALVLHSPVEEWNSGSGSALDALMRVAGACDRTRGCSDAVGQMLVADGSAEILLEHEPCGEWDWAACMVIVEEAGGRMTTSAGDPPSSGCDLLVTNGALHEVVRGLLGSSEGPDVADP